ncbi:mercuric reductase [Chitinophaga barathri]|uniref:Mercuric reductase n=1 Tax=Chitinophaga barathri TaxID=1647451 RepID=A0A3N4MNX3_9BACT|nr:mercuric reductase [Chitinophaga barathri]RPD41379.1 mercuric reductase [Chitinophaga barathri]
MNKFDAIVIGAGQAGIPLAKKLAAAGRRTALIEKRFLGGTCVNDGCTPTKTMIAVARLSYLSRKAQAFGIPSDPSQLNLSAVLDRKNEVVNRFRSGLEKGVKDIKNLEMFSGTASFTGPDTLSVNGETLSAEHIFINTGARPMIPAIPGLADIPYLTSTTILDLDKIPEHLAIIGSGYIAMELGQMYARFGSRVTILERNAAPLEKEDDDVAACIRQILEEDNVTFLTNAAVNKVSRNLDGQTELTLMQHSEEKRITCSHLLVAAGRAPNTEELNLSLAGVKTGPHGYIEVNDRLETSAPGIYAMGDVKGGPAFTHISYNDHLIVAHNIIDKQNLSIKDRMIPYCMFTDPELGRVGLTEKEALKQGFKIKVATLPLSRVARGIETGDTRGLMKAVINTENKQILGAAILSVSGGEIMSVLQMAMTGNITYEQLRDTAFAHPTFSESLNNLFLSLDND